MADGRLEDRWDQTLAASMSEPERLRYRSNLLGADKRITNFGGGNTSAKVEETDPLTGEPVSVLWVKGSGGDLGSMDLSGFATLYMAKLEALKGLYRGIEHEDEMVGYLPHCTFNLNPRAASIDTPLHAYLPYTHVDHVHPDAVIAIAAAEQGEALTAEIFEGELGWLPWQRPGYDLGLKLEEVARSDPSLVGVVLGGHGLFTWAEDSADCYRTTLRIIQKAQDWLDARASGPAFGGSKLEPLPKAESARKLQALLPRLRGLISRDERKLGHVDASDTVLEFVNANDLEPLAALGTSCPDHFLRTKIRPLVVPADIDDLEPALERYRDDYRAYYERCKHADSPAIRDPNPVIYLLPGTGMVSFAANKPTARIASEFYINAINVIRGAFSVSTYVGLDEQEAFDIEYWLLEEAKLQRMPKPKSLAGRIAVVTGAAGGIGQAVARRLAGEGACVLLTDRDEAPLAEAEQALAQAFGTDLIAGRVGDVTSEADMAAVVAATTEIFGGLDIVVANAGLASAAPFDETSLDDWQRNADVLAKGVFLTAREGFRVMKAQGLGGSIVTIGSKNALAASAGASAYCAAKAAALHLTRCIALEGAPHGIRANMVNPDAVLRGSRIWQGDWKTARAQAYGVEEGELERVYRERSLLKRSVFPEDIAEAVYWLASDLSSKTTGNALNVDAGNAVAFTR
ncbi:MAG: bifunctional rhamnulose-1-phosphate aldolase/short-chain dehydrogenase [Geminicoccaceae bacterium]